MKKDPHEKNEKPSPTTDASIYNHNGAFLVYWSSTNEPEEPKGTWEKRRLRWTVKGKPLVETFNRGVERTPTGRYGKPSLLSAGELRRKRGSGAKKRNEARERERAT